MFIKTNEKDNNSNIKMKIINKTAIILLSTIVVTIGSGMQPVKAQSITQNYTNNEYVQMGEENIIHEGIEWNSENEHFFEEGQRNYNEEKSKIDKQKFKEAGYNYFFTGQIPEGIEWSEELKEYWEQGITEARNSNIEYEKWEKMGYDFISKGIISEDMDYEGKIPGKLALQNDAYQKGIKKALEEGSVVNKDEIKPLDSTIENPTQAQINLEEYRKILSEGWFDMGKESINDIEFFEDKTVSSLSDNYFKIRGMDISASSIVNAGRNLALKEKSNITFEGITQLVKNERFSNIEETMKEMIKKEKDKDIKGSLEINEEKEDIGD